MCLTAVTLSCRTDAVLVSIPSPTGDALVRIVRRYKPGVASYNHHIVALFDQHGRAARILADVHLPDPAYEEPFVYGVWARDGRSVVGVICGRDVDGPVVFHGALDGHSVDEVRLYRYLEDSLATQLRLSDISPGRSVLDTACYSKQNREHDGPL